MRMLKSRAPPRGGGRGGVGWGSMNAAHLETMKAPFTASSGTLTCRLADVLDQGRLPHNLSGSPEPLCQPTQSPTSSADDDEYTSYLTMLVVPRQTPHTIETAQQSHLVALQALYIAGDTPQMQRCTEVCRGIDELQIIFAGTCRMPKQDKERHTLSDNIKRHWKNICCISGRSSAY